MGTRVTESFSPSSRSTPRSSIAVPNSPCSLNESFPQEDDELVKKQQEASQSNSFAETSQKFANVGVGLVSVLSEHVLSHPFVVLRRQCQVQHEARWFHLTPFTLFQPIYNIQRHQSLGTLWKGIGSSLLVKCMVVSSETAISEVTGLPREVSRHSPVKKLAQHVILKSVTLALVTPFYASSLVETVQSEIASDAPGLLDWFREGCARLMSLSVPPATRLLPVWKLFSPMIVHGLLHYAISSLARYTVRLSLKTEQKKKNKSGDPSSQAPTTLAANEQYTELVANLTGALLADLMLYPLQTILHRLCLQGTRTIVDNTDTGLGVLPIITRYEGAIDCLKCILQEEGVLGLYKGLGALVLQFGMHMVILRFTRTLCEAVASHGQPPPLITPDKGLVQSTSYVPHQQTPRPAFNPSASSGVRPRQFNSDKSQKLLPAWSSPAYGMSSGRPYSRPPTHEPWPYNWDPK